MKISRQIVKSTQFIFTRFLLILLLNSTKSFSQAGTLDSSFGVNGKVVDTTLVGSGVVTIDNFSEAKSVAIQEDGKIVVAGYLHHNDESFAIARYNTDGSFDSTFGVNGKVISDFDTGTKVGSAATSVLIQPDGKILAGGYVYHYASDNFALARYLPNGSLDSSFGINGKVSTFLGERIVLVYLDINRMVLLTQALVLMASFEMV